MKIKSLTTVLLSFFFLSLGYCEEKNALKGEYLLGPASSKKWNLNFEREVTEKTNIFLEYARLEDGISENSWSLDGEHEVNDSLTTNASLTYSKDETALEGKGLDLSLDYNFDHLLAQDLSTMMSFSFGGSYYSKEEKINSTKEITSYYQFLLGLSIDQDITSFLSLSLGANHYFYVDNSQIVSSTGKKQKVASSFNANESSLENKIFAGFSFHQETFPSLSYEFSLTKYKDGTNSNEHDLTVSYKLKTLTLALVYQNIKPSEGKMENWFGPRVTFKF